MTRAELKHLVETVTGRRVIRMEDDPLLVTVFVEGGVTAEERAEIRVRTPLTITVSLAEAPPGMIEGGAS